MAKYNFEFKLEVVTAYLAGKGVYKSLANQFSISDKSTVRKWVKVYEAMGESGLKRRKSHKTYSVQFKLDVLQYKLRTEESHQDVALKFNMHEPSIVANWMRIWNKEGIDGLSKPKGRPPMSKKKRQKKNDNTLTREQQLEREIEILRAENAYLKKLRASGINIPSRLRK